MREITHRIKIYTAAHKAPFHLLAGSTVFRLLFAHLVVSTIALALHYVDKIWWGGVTYQYTPYWVLLGETLFVLAALQLNLLRAFAKDRDIFPEAPTNSLRVAYRRSHQRKFRALILAFAAPRDFRSLAEEIREQHRWHTTVRGEIDLANGLQARKLLKLPSSSTLANYLLGAVGLAATLIVAFMQREELIESLPKSWVYFKAIMIIASVVLAAFILLVPATWNGLRASGLTLRETLDDDYLSARSLYAFVADLLELDEIGKPRLLLKTSGRVYWLIRILTAPMSRLGTVIRQARKSGRIGKLRRKQRQLVL